MLCPKCGKESNNLRVCAFCHTPYPLDAIAQAGTPASTRATAAIRASKVGTAQRAAGDPRNAMERRSRLIRRGSIGALAAFTIGYYIVTRDRVIPVGVAIPNLIARPMPRGQAIALLNTMNGNARVEVRSGELTVRSRPLRFRSGATASSRW